MTGVDALIVFVFAGVRYRDLLPLLSYPRFERRVVVQLVVLALVFTALMSIYFTLIQHAGIPMVRIAQTYQKFGWPVWSMYLLVSVMPAVFEELAFRGVIQTTLERVVSEREAWFIQAALFSVLHLLPMVFPSHFLMGLCFGYMRLRSRSLYPSMLLHAGWNALVLYEELVGV